MKGYLITRAWPRIDGTYEWAACANLHMSEEVADADKRLQQLQHPDFLVVKHMVELPTPHTQVADV